MELTPNLCLAADLGLDSILRIELVSRIEETLGIVIEERFITHKTTIQELEELLRTIPASVIKPSALKKWPFSNAAYWLRSILLKLVIHPFLSLFVSLRIEGIESLKNLKTPILIMPNHRSYLDSAVLFWAMPAVIRQGLAIATALDMRRYFWWMVPLWELLYASFPFPRQEEENMEAGLEAVGKLLDQNHSIMIYPEGRISPTKELLPLKRGAGLLATEMGVPVLPVFIENTERILPYGKMIPRRRGPVTVRFGKLLFFHKNDSYVEATEKIQQALQSLKKSTAGRKPAAAHI
jgi:long-chain acyl-CoA synthetase